MDTPSIADFPDELERLAEWRRRRVEAEQSLLRDTATGPDALEEAKKFRNLAHMGDTLVSP